MTFPCYAEWVVTMCWLSDHLFGKELIVGFTVHIIDECLSAG